MRKKIFCAVLLLSVLIVVCYWKPIGLRADASGQISAISGQKIGRPEGIPGVIRFSLPNPDWYLADGVLYRKYDPIPEVLVLNRVVKSAVVRINLRETGVSPTSIIRFFSLTYIVQSDVSCRWLKNDGGERPARIRFDNAENGKVGLVEARHLPGRWSHVLIVGGSWPAAEHRKMTLEFDRLLESIVADSR